MQSTEELIEALKNAGVFVKASEHKPASDVPVFWRLIQGTDAGYNKLGPILSCYKPENVFWLNTSHPALTSLIELLEVRDGDEKSDFQACVDYKESSRHDPFDTSEIFLDGRQSLRSELSPKIKALEQKVKEQNEVMKEIASLLANEESAIDTCINIGNLITRYDSITKQ